LPWTPCRKKCVDKVVDNFVVQKRTLNVNHFVVKHFILFQPFGAGSESDCRQRIDDDGTLNKRKKEKHDMSNSVGHIQENNRFHHVLVAGAGTMGHGLALLMAAAGCKVSLSDPSDSALETALDLAKSHLAVLAEEGQVDGATIPTILDRIHLMKPAQAPDHVDLVLETISEDVEAKRAFLAEIATRVRPDTVVASNTSYLNVFDLAPATVQERLLICHFFAPPYIIPLVEIVKGPKTDPEVVERLRAFLLAIGQTPVLVEKFVPGFIVNRLQRALGREIFHLIDQGYAQPEQIDKAVLASLGIRIPVLGVVKRYDFAGLDFTSRVLSNPSIGLASEDRPSAAVDQHVAQGHTGVKSGRGFYDYSRYQPGEIYAKRDRLLIKMRRIVAEIEKTFWQD
jgi:3-hydroxybutyryl-CoA dehydrogenase